MSDPRIIPKDELGRMRVSLTRLRSSQVAALIDHADAMDERDAARVALIRELARALDDIRVEIILGDAELKAIRRWAAEALACVPEEYRP